MKPGTNISESSETTHEHTTKKQPSSKSLSSWIKVSSILAFLTTYSHFFGFSFLKGQLEQMGFYSSDINLMVNETLHLTSSGVAEGLKQIITHGLNDEAVLRNGITTAICVSLTVAFILFQPTTKKVIQNLADTTRPKMRWLRWIKAPTLIIISGAAGFALQVIGGLLIVMLFSTLWFGLSLGNHLGRSSIESLMNQGICNSEINLDALDWSKENREVVLSCSSIQDSGQQVFGRIIHQDSKQLYFLTNDAAYHLNMEGKILFKNQYKTRARDSEKSKNKSL